MARNFVTSDGYDFAWDEFAPPGEPRGRVVVVHGIRSHAGWYAGSCQKLAAAGYEVCFLERRGAGRNTAARGDAPGFRRLRQDIVEFVTSRPPLRTHLMGISWGGKLALAASAVTPVASLVLVAPGFVPRVRTSLRERLRFTAARLFAPTKLFDVPLNAPELFTRDPAWQAYLRTNPHDTHRATARFFVGSAALDFRLRRTPNPTPTLTLLAGDDRVIDNAATRAFVAKFAHPANRVVEYAGLAHTLEFEDRELAFVGDILAWLAGV